MDQAPLDEQAIPELVAAVYETATPDERSQLLEHLLRPLGLLSLFGIADGAFAALRFRGGWQELSIQAEDAQAVQASQVTALAEHVQQVSVETIDSLAQMLVASPMLAGSAAATLLVTVLVRRARRRQADSGEL